MTPNSELLGDTARTSQTSPASMVTVAPLLASRWPDATSTTSARTCCGTVTPACLPLLADASRALANRTTLRCMTVGEVVFDRGVNVGYVERHREAPRERIEVAQVDFALARGLQLTFEPGRELAHHYRDEDEQNEIEDLVRVL